MHRSCQNWRTLPLIVLALVAACDQSTSPDNSAKPTLSSSGVPALGTRGSANPPCTHHWKGGTGPGVGSDWFADTLWAEGSVPAAGASVCIGQVAAGNGYPAIGDHGSATVTIAALTVTHGGLLLFGSMLTVTGEVDCTASCFTIQLTDGSTLSASLLVLDGSLTSAGSSSNVLRADIVNGATGRMELFQNLILDKVDFAWTNDGIATSITPGLYTFDIPASTGHPTVVVNGGGIRGMSMRAGTFTSNGGTISGSILNGFFDNVNLSFGPSEPVVSITVRSSAGGATLSGTLPAGGFVNLEGSGSGTNTTVQLLGNVTNHSTLNLIPGTGAVLNLTGSGTLSNAAPSGQIIAKDGAGEVHVQVDLDDKSSFSSNIPAFLDKPSGLYTFSGSLVSSTAPLTVASGASIHVVATTFVQGDIDVRGSHLTMEAPFALGTLRNLQGSAVDLGTGFKSVTLDGYEQDATSALTLKVGGTTAGTSQDQISVKGAAVLGGTLNVTTVTPFVGGVCGQIASIVSVYPQGSVSGTFPTVTGLSLTSTRRWGVVYPVNDVVLRGFDPTSKLGVAPTTVSIAEGGASAPYSVCLSQQPTADVAVAVTPNVQVTPTGFLATFSAADWWQPKATQLWAVDDGIVEPLVQPTIATHSASSIDPFFNGATANFTASITDNDGNADLALTITAPPPPIFLNQNFSVSFRSRDIGPTLSTGATFSVPANPAFRFVSATGATCAPSGGNLVCQLAGIASGGQANFILTMKPVQRGVFSFTMTLAGQQPDPNGANNVITRNITVN